MDIYKEKYEQALFAMKQRVEAGIIDECYAEEIFPELKESEDEKIRKELIEFVRNRGGFKQEWISWLEKQCEQPQGKSALEAVKEVKVDNQNCVKPTDKVKPKFRVGDWITNGIDFTFQIRSIKDNMYLRSDDYFIDIETADKKFRLWSIQDAKDGDVLSYRDGQWIFIYKGIVTEDTFKYYALLSEKGITVNNAAFSLLTSCIIPATKEQREQLLKAIADAGYTFDFEKKELKKIEQKPAENEELTEFDKAVGVSIGTWNPKTPEQIQSVKAVSKKLLKLAKKQINDEQNPAWSEEDEMFVHGLIRGLAAKRDIHGHTTFSSDCIDITKTISWLKSLKDRVQPQPKLEWSVEDEEQFSFCCAAIELSNYSSDEYRNYAISFLESLRERVQPQPQWKPSDEQLECLKNN